VTVIVAVILTCSQFSFFNNFSGQIAYESWTLSFYNVLFTLLPPLVIGVFDQFVSARILDRYPQLYRLGQSNAFFTKTAFWMWIGNALYHSIVRACSSHFIFRAILIHIYRLRTVSLSFCSGVT
jgi:phospholipid-transporting ATPase